jgi:hypothetical protein
VVVVVVVVMNHGQDLRTTRDRRGPGYLRGHFYHDVACRRENALEVWMLKSS